MMRLFEPKKKKMNMREVMSEKENINETQEIETGEIKVTGSGVGKCGPTKGFHPV
jgi:hypothetical protein